MDSVWVRTHLSVDWLRAGVARKAFHIVRPGNCIIIFRKGARERNIARAAGGERRQQTVQHQLLAAAAHLKVYATLQTYLHNTIFQLTLPVWSLVK